MVAPEQHLRLCPLPAPASAAPCCVPHIECTSKHLLLPQYAAERLWGSQIRGPRPPLGWPPFLASGRTWLFRAWRFGPDSGHYLLTAGYDNTSRLWGGPRFRLLRTLAGHEGKVMGADISPDGSFTVATTGYDRTIKVWRGAGCHLAAVLMRDAPLFGQCK